MTRHLGPWLSPAFLLAFLAWPARADEHACLTRPTMPDPVELTAQIPAELLAVPLELRRAHGVTQAGAEALFGRAHAAVYFWDRGEVLFLAHPAPSPLPRWLRPATPLAIAGAPAVLPEGILESEEHLGTATLADFAQLATSEGTLSNAPPDGHFLLMFPVHEATAQQHVAASPKAVTTAAPLPIVLSESFEGDPWTRWQRLDVTGGRFAWNKTRCVAHTGAWAADAVRAGSLGLSLGCDDTYPVPAETTLLDRECETLAGASEAWLDLYLAHATAKPTDTISVLYSSTTGVRWGYGFSGTVNGWWHAVFNLRQWFGIGDLVAQSCPRLQITFRTNAGVAAGFGARVDDVTIRTGALADLTCSITATQSSDTAPLTVSFTGNVSGATAATYLWDLGEGASATTPNATHTYIMPGTYNVTLRVTDGSRICACSRPLTVGSGGVPPQAGKLTGTTSQGKPFELTVDAFNRITSWYFGYWCGSSSGTMSATSQQCQVTDGMFICGRSGCPTSMGLNSRFSGIFTSPTAASGTLAVYSNAVPGATCCTLEDLTWGANLTTPGPTVTANADVTSGVAPLTVHFQGSATGGTPPYSFQWGFADGTAASTEESPTHTFANSGTYAVTLAVRDSTGLAGGTTVNVTATAPAQVFRYYVPAVAHISGVGGTQWRTDVGGANGGTSPATVTLLFTSDTETIQRGVTLAAGGAVEWINVLESLFGMTATAKSSGSIEIASNVPLTLTARTYNQTTTGTFGQYYPALTTADGITINQVGMITQLKRSAAYRTNIGVMNVGPIPCTVRIRLFEASGAQVGDTKLYTVNPGRWVQETDFFAKIKAGDRLVAYATVEVLDPGGLAWAYASVVDNNTGDPTTFPLLVQGP